MKQLDLIAAAYCRAAYMEPEEFSEFVGVPACHIHGPEHGADVFVFETDECNFVIFRGTEVAGGVSMRDMRTVLRFARKRINGTGKPLGLHAGMFEAWREVSDIVGEEILQLRITQQHEDDEVKPTVYAGHSMGGALAGMAAATQGADHLIMFGSPRWSGSAVAPLLHDTDVRRWVYEADWVPRVPFGFGYRHVGQLHYLTRHGKVVKDASVFRTATRFFMRFRLRWADHAMSNYCAGLFAALVEGEEFA